MRILSIDGGGYLGLASASFLDATERHFELSSHDQFDLYCGTSTGAIIALGLASGMSAAEIVDLYEELGPKVFPPAGKPRRTFRWLKGLAMSRYSNKHLRAALNDAFGDITLGDLHAAGKKVLITAFNLSNGEPRVFKTDHSPNLTLDGGYRLADIALASAAAPVYLPVVTLSAPVSGLEEKFCDGGLFANHPALLGLAEAVDDLCVPPGEVEILSVSTPRSDLAEHESASPWWKGRVARRGAFMWLPSIMNLAIDSTSKIAHHSLERLARAMDFSYQRVLLKKPRGLEIDTATPAATRTLRQIGARQAEHSALRADLRCFFGKDH